MMGRINPHILNPLSVLSPRHIGFLYLITRHCLSSIESQKARDISGSDTIPLPPLYKYMDVTSASRGIFGSQFDVNAFGHGDRLFLDWLMARHDQFVRITEFGTFTGVTTLYLGMWIRFFLSSLLLCYYYLFYTL
jgi:hypothetical protein